MKLKWNQLDFAGKFGRVIGTLLAWAFILFVIAGGAFSAWAVIFALFQINHWLGVAVCGAFGLVIAIDLIGLLITGSIIKHQ